MVARLALVDDAVLVVEVALVLLELARGVLVLEVQLLIELLRLLAAIQDVGEGITEGIDPLGEIGVGFDAGVA